MVGRVLNDLSNVLFSNENNNGGINGIVKLSLVVSVSLFAISSLVCCVKRFCYSNKSNLKGRVDLQQRQRRIENSGLEVACVNGTGASLTSQSVMPTRNNDVKEERLPESIDGLPYEIFSEIFKFCDTQSLMNLVFSRVPCFMDFYENDNENFWKHSIKDLGVPIFSESKFVDSNAKLCFLLTVGISKYLQKERIASSIRDFLTPEVVDPFAAPKRVADPLLTFGRTDFVNNFVDNFRDSKQEFTEEKFLGSLQVLLLSNFYLKEWGKGDDKYLAKELHEKAERFKFCKFVFAEYLKCKKENESSEEVRKLINGIKKIIDFSSKLENNDIKILKVDLRQLFDEEHHDIARRTSFGSVIDGSRFSALYSSNYFRRSISLLVKIGEAVGEAIFKMFLEDSESSYDEFAKKVCAKELNNVLFMSCAVHKEDIIRI